MTYCKLEIYVPSSAAEAVLQAVAAAGAGHLGNYDSCAWTTSGVGRFRPLSGSHPSIGSVGRLEKVAEVKIETFCPQTALPKVLAALRAAHPYEQPAYYLTPVCLDEKEFEDAALH